MVYIQRIFKKEITIQIESHTEENIYDVAQYIKNYVTERFYGCDTKIVESKLMVKTDKVQAKANIEYYKEQLKSLCHEKNIAVSQRYRDVIDSDIEETKKKIKEFEKLL